MPAPRNSVGLASGVGHQHEKDQEVVGPEQQGASGPAVIEEVADGDGAGALLGDDEAGICGRRRSRQPLVKPCNTFLIAAGGDQEAD